MEGDPEKPLAAPHQAQQLPSLQIAATGPLVPETIAGAGEDAARRFIEFFAARIRNRNTRAAYYRAVTRFFAWWELQALGALTLTKPDPVMLKIIDPPDAQLYARMG